MMQVNAAACFGALPVKLRTGLVGAGADTIAWFAPDLAGGGCPFYRYHTSFAHGNNPGT